MPRQYKNVYTILDKVKKGEIDSYYKEDDGLFGKINFYKKPDLIKPHMHYIDEGRLDSIVKKHVEDPAIVSKIYENCRKSRLVGCSQDVFEKSFKKMYNSFPKHMTRDIFKLYYNNMERISFEDRTDTNNTKFKFLEVANHPIGKIMSETSNLKSAIFSRNIVEYFITRLAILDCKNSDEADDLAKSLESGSEFDLQQSQKTMKKIFESNESKEMFEKNIEQAQEVCRQIDRIMDKDLQEDVFDSINIGNEPLKLDSNYLDTVAEKINKIKIQMGCVKEKIKKLLDKSINYFSSKSKPVYDDLFNSESIAGLEDFELLHPKLRKAFVEDLQVKETKSVGKIDIYIDASGSMGSQCGIEDDAGNLISKIDFCKSFILKIKSLNLLNNLYSFNTKVKARKTDVISISMMAPSGGTSINAVIDSINSNNRNAIIITDAEDFCNQYSDKAFFIGVNGANFNNFSDSTIEKYSDKDQVIIFDGETIKKVNKNGHVIR